MDILESSYIALIVLILLALLAVYIFFLLTLQRTLEAIDVSSRTMNPGQVWLTLIPVFSLIWQFILVARIYESIKNECNRLHIPAEAPKPTYSAGMAMAILSVCSIIPGIGTIASFLSIVALMVYWRKVNRYKNLIIASQQNFMFDAEREAAERIK